MAEEVKLKEYDFFLVRHTSFVNYDTFFVQTKEIVKAVESAQGELDALVQKLHNQTEEVCI